MSSSGDEDDEFLYGSDSESKVTQNQEKKRKLQTSDDENKGSSKKLKASDGSSYDNLRKNESESNSDSSDNDESDSASSDEESDSDVEFIISTGADTTRLDSASTSTSAAPIQPSGISVATAPVEDVTEAAKGTDVSNKEITPGAVPTGMIDLEAEGTFEGQPVTSLDPEVLKEKPWRQPGANLGDYFNYGFNEFTWMEYLHRQEKLQPEYNPHKILMGLLTLQQQGKLNGSNKMDSSISGGGDINNNTGINSNMPMNQHGVNRPMPPPGFPPLPMFGGFSPFGMPGMMPPMNQNQQNQQKK